MRLGLLVPPPAAVAIAAVLAWAQATWLPLLPFGRQLGAAIAVAIASGVLAVLAAREFRRAGTTVNPLHPERASRLVTSGPFSFSRNPIYVADALLISAWVLWLGDAAAFAVVPLFIAFLTRFQILPEERALRERFGEAYREYASRVRRWL